MPRVMLLGSKMSLVFVGAPVTVRVIGVVKGTLLSGISVKVKVAGIPAVTVAVAGEPVIEKSGAVTSITVTSVAVLFPGVLSPPPETTAVLVKLAGATPETFTVKVIAGYAAPPARTSLLVHIRMLSVQVHPVPAIAVAVSPAGSRSVA